MELRNPAGRSREGRKVLFSQRTKKLRNLVLSDELNVMYQVLRHVQLKQDQDERLNPD